MPTAQDEHPVEELSSNRSHPSLSEGVGLGGSDRGEDHLRPFGLEHLVEGTGELIVAIADEVAYRCPAIITVEGEVSRLRAMEEGRIEIAESVAEWSAAIQRWMSIRSLCAS